MIVEIGGPRRPTQISSPNELLGLVEGGYADGILDELSKTVINRKQERLAEAIKALQEAVGDQSVHIQNGTVIVNGEEYIV